MFKTAPRISRKRRSEVPASTAAIYDRYMRRRGNVPNMFRTMANQPEIFETMIAHFEAILNTGTAPVKLKKLVIVRTSQIDCCDYCLGSNTQIAQRLGWSRNQIENLADFEDRDDFTPTDEAALRLAEKMTVDSNNVPDTLNCGHIMTKAKLWNSWLRSAYSIISTGSIMH
jgi:AhpD family alkylhydroperoxidase